MLGSGGLVAMICTDTCCRPEDEFKVVIIRKSYPRARKEHRCSQCDQMITVGWRYALTVYLIDGEFGWDRTHYDWGIPCLPE